MKKIILLCLVLVFSVHSFSQQITPVPAINTDLMKKAKHQKLAAIIMFNGWPVIFWGGIIIAWVTEDPTGGFVIAITGLVTHLSSIPLIIAYHHNKKKAMNASAYFKMEQAPQLQGSSFTTKPVPAFTLKISLWKEYIISYTPSSLHRNNPRNHRYIQTFKTPFSGVLFFPLSSSIQVKLLIFSLDIRSIVNSFYHQN